MKAVSPACLCAATIAGFSLGTGTSLPGNSNEVLVVFQEKRAISRRLHGNNPRMLHQKSKQRSRRAGVATGTAGVGRQAFTAEALLVALRGGGKQQATPVVSTENLAQAMRQTTRALPHTTTAQSMKKHGQEPHGDMSVSTAILNLVADLCPHGMLPVAYGMAAAGGTGLVVAPALLAAFGITSAYTMISIGRACEHTRQWSFRGLWADLVGKESAWVVECAVASMCFGCCIFYSAFMGDLFAALAASASFVPAFFKKRAVDLVMLTICPLLPLCLMKNLSALQYTSFFGVLSILYTTAFVVKRSLDGSYKDGGVFFQAIDSKFRSPVADPWATVNLWRVGPGFVTLMNMACVAFMAHYNSVKYYEELENRSVRKYTITIGTGMMICLGVFCTMMLFGFRTFGPAAQALILNNYHRTADPLASLARIATGCSILCGYPLMFAALKMSFFNAGAEISAKFGDGGKKLSKRFLSDEGLRTSCIVSLMAVVATVACNQTEEDVAVVVGLIGAILGSAANYIIPAVFNLSLLKRMGDKRGLFSEVSLNKLIIAFGFVFMVMGTAVTLRDAGSHGGGHEASGSVM